MQQTRMVVGEPVRYSFLGANKLFLRSLEATVSVLPWMSLPDQEEKKEIEIVIQSYNPSLLPTIKALCEDGSVIITQSKEALVTPVPSQNTLFVTVYVPNGTYLFAEGPVLLLHIGNILGPLHLVSHGVGLITAGQLTSVSATMKGSASMSIGHVNGNTKFILVGDPKVRILGGSSEFLDCEIFGSGKLVFSGECAYAKVSITGSGEIWAPTIENMEETIVGSGRVYKKLAG